MASKEINEDEDNLPRVETWKDFLYNPDKKTVLGRTGISWLKITVFYVFFFTALAGWFAGLLHAFYSTLDDDAPTHYGNSSLIQNNPALGVRPMPLYDSTMIRFARGQESSYRPYTDHLEAFLKTYENVSETITCNSTRNASTGNACSIDVQSYLNEIGCTRANDYGYFDGKPCVAIKMNKVFAFEPKPYPDMAAITADLKAREEVRYLSYADGNIGVSCDGQNGVDKQYITDVKFAPGDGLEMLFFPYTNQVGYRSPVIIAKFEVEPMVTIQVLCRLWAIDIDNSDGKEKRGSVHFELYIN